MASIALTHKAACLIFPSRKRKSLSNQTNQTVRSQAAFSEMRENGDASYELQEDIFQVSFGGHFAIRAAFHPRVGPTPRKEGSRQTVHLEAGPNMECP
jgi:hypothetical protein